MLTRRYFVPLCLLVVLLSLLPANPTLASTELIPPVLPAAGTTDCSLTLQFGETVLCSLAVASEVDQFTFTGAAGNYVLIRMASRTTSVEPQVRVVNSSGTTICQAQSYSPVADIDTCAIPASGTYTILVNDYSGGNTGNYGLSLQRLNNPVNVAVLSYGQTTAASLIASGEVDTYTITAEGSDTLFLRMAVTSSGLRPYMRLYAADGAKRCEVYSYGAIADLTTCPRLAAGHYTLVVTTLADNTTGNYSLAVQRTNNPSHASALDFSIPRTTTLAAAAEVDTYTFSATVNDTVVLRMGSETSGLKPLIRLYGPNGIKLCEAYSYSSAGELEPCLLPTTGTYVALISSFNDVVTGSYGITLQRVNRASAVSPLVPGITASSTLTTSGQLATYTFPATSGDAIYLRLGTTSSDLKPHVRVFADDGSKVCEAYSYSLTADIGSCLMPRTGIYTVLVNALNTASRGGYALTMQRVNQPETERSMYFGRVITGALTSNGDSDAYSFTAEGNSSVLLRMSTTVSGVNPYVQLYSRDGTRLCSAYSYNATAEISKCLLPSDGLYTVIAASREGGISDYNLTLTCLSGTCGAVQPPEKQTYVPFVTN